MNRPSLLSARKIGVFALFLATACAQSTPDGALFATDSSASDTQGRAAGDTSTSSGGASMDASGAKPTTDAGVTTDAGSTDKGTTPDSAMAGSDTGASKAGTVHVPEGSFARGCNAAADSACAADEKPFRILIVNAFDIDRHEVTVARWLKCIDGGGCGKPTKTFKSHGKGFTYGAPGQDQHPVTGVTWQQAADFCKWAGGRLPTEAEWEKAARGSCKTVAPKACNTNAQVYPWGDDVANCELAVMNYGGDGCGKGETWPVGSKPDGASPYGALDMAGNAWEWVADRYAADYYATADSKNPKGPTKGSTRVMRGGSAYWSADYLRASARSKEDPAAAELDVGFRCVYEP